MEMGGVGSECVSKRHKRDLCGDEYVLDFDYISSNEDIVLYDVTTG